MWVYRFDCLCTIVFIRVIVIVGHHATRVLAMEWGLIGWTSSRRHLHGSHVFVNLIWVLLSSSFLSRTTFLSVLVSGWLIVLGIFTDDEWIYIGHAQRPTSVGWQTWIRLVNSLLIPSNQLAPYMVSLVLFCSLVDSFAFILDSQMVFFKLLNLASDIAFANVYLSSHAFLEVVRREVSLCLGIAE